MVLLKPSLILWVYLLVLFWTKSWKWMLSALILFKIGYKSQAFIMNLDLRCSFVFGPIFDKIWFKIKINPEVSVVFWQKLDIRASSKSVHISILDSVSFKWGFIFCVTLNFHSTFFTMKIHAWISNSNRNCFNTRYIG